MNNDAVVVAFTGAFGSGCSTAADQLASTRGFTLLELSSPVKSAWKDLHPGQEPIREDLQRMGDQLREDHGTTFLVDTVVKKLTTENRIVFDGIRNLGEVDRIRQLFHNATIISVLSWKEDRWTRISRKYTDQKRTKDDFDEDDMRDRNEETKYGQQVELCLDRADILIDNTRDVTLPQFRAKIKEYVDFVLGVKRRPATAAEIHMNIAFAAARSSKCLKRQVGAVIVDARGQVVSVGYNENPFGTHPCAEEPSYGFQCYRDIVRNGHFADLAQRGVRCPKCGSPLPKDQDGPPWRCEECNKKGRKINLESFFFPDRAMSWCTAIHAETSAILAAGDRARNATLFTTTFPCFQCAEKITQAGISTVYFSEVYPDQFSGTRLQLSGVELRQFEGIRSTSFERFFPRAT